ncbi:MAG: hypothetical protein NTV51_18190 [Verrucomicrobia bacterium]|nr:hypothetical protein [Verrucomicrobiota bacterium]
MNITTIGASPTHRLPAEFPAWSQPPQLAALHDFLVPNPRPDLAAEPPAQPRPRARRRYDEPDSMFWSPESHAGDAA